MIIVEHDPSKPFGHALLRIDDPDLGPVPDGLRLRIRLTAGEMPYLGPDGWQAQPAELDPLSVRQDEDGIELALGPQINDVIPADECVEVTVVGIGRKDEVYWPFVPPSPAGSGVKLSDGDPPPVVKAPVDVPPETPEQPVTPPRGTGEPPVVPPPGGPDDPPEAKSRWWLWLLLLLLLAAIAAGLWFYLDRRDAPEDSVPAPVSQQAPIDWQGRYIALLDADPDGSGLLAFNAEALDAGEDDLAFRALDASAERNNAEALMRLAQLYDPATFDDRFFSQPNPTRALDLYERADDAGDPTADDAAMRLCEAAGAADGADPFADFDLDRCP